MNAILLEELGDLVRIHLAEDLVAVARVCDDDNVIEVNAAYALSANTCFHFNQRTLFVLFVVIATIVWHHDSEPTIAEGLDRLAELGRIVVEGRILDSFVVQVLSLDLLADHLLVLGHFGC